MMNMLTSDYQTAEGCAVERLRDNDAPLQLGCSVISVLHAENPKSIFETAISKLKERVAR
jgi:hypothetical protein